MPYRSPTQRAVTPQHRGRFPGFDVLDTVDQWDDVTAGVVLARLVLPNELSFFTPHEYGIAEALTDLILGQDGEPRIPVVPLIDARLAAGETDGWHYDDLPEDGPAYPRGYLNPGVNAREKWEVADTVDVDPVPFADRVERARRQHANLLDDEGGS
jgi:hypothetical protein